MPAASPACRASTTMAPFTGAPGAMTVPDMVSRSDSTNRVDPGTGGEADNLRNGRLPSAAATTT